MNQNNILVIFADDSGADCVVCMCDIRDTIILPCRHLCLCYTCAESLRFQVTRDLETIKRNLRHSVDYLFSKKFKYHIYSFRQTTALFVGHHLERCCSFEPCRKLVMQLIQH